MISPLRCHPSWDAMTAVTVRAWRTSNKDVTDTRKDESYDYIHHIHLGNHIDLEMINMFYTWKCFLYNILYDLERHLEIQEMFISPIII